MIYVDLDISFNLNVNMLSIIKMFVFVIISIILKKFLNEVYLEIIWYILKIWFNRILIGIIKVKDNYNILWL